jgi:hypothetical protein
MAQESAAHREDVEQLQRRFAEWRGTHAVRTRLPEELWAAAAELAQRDGMDATARALEVDKPSLRKWADRLRPQRQPRPRGSPPKRRGKAVPTFVELLASGSGATASCLIEVESSRGGKLRLELKAIETSQLAELIRAFAAS